MRRLSLVGALLLAAAAGGRWWIGTRADAALTGQGLAWADRTDALTQIQWHSLTGPLTARSLTLTLLPWPAAELQGATV